MKLTAAWPADVSSPYVTGYEVHWTSNGVPLATVPVPAVPGQTSYASDFPNALNPGDVDGVTVDSVDQFGQKSPEIASTPPAVTVPTPAAPAGPASVTLTLTTP